MKRLTKNKLANILNVPLSQLDGMLMQCFLASNEEVREKLSVAGYKIDTDGNEL